MSLRCFKISSRRKRAYYNFEQMSILLNAYTWVLKNAAMRQKRLPNDKTRPTEPCIMVGADYKTLLYR
jgi:hypothetical protein